jgi:hypothetical protein
MDVGGEANSCSAGNRNMDRQSYSLVSHTDYADPAVHCIAGHC